MKCARLLLALALPLPAASYAASPELPGHSIADSRLIYRDGRIIIGRLLSSSQVPALDGEGIASYQGIIQVEKALFGSVPHEIEAMFIVRIAAGKNHPAVETPPNIGQPYLLFLHRHWQDCWLVDKFEQATPENISRIKQLISSH